MRTHILWLIYLCIQVSQVSHLEQECQKLTDKNKRLESSKESIVRKMEEQQNEISRLGYLEQKAMQVDSLKRQLEEMRLNSNLYTNGGTSSSTNLDEIEVIGLRDKIASYEIQIESLLQINQQLSDTVLKNQSSPTSPSRFPVSSFTRKQYRRTVNSVPQNDYLMANNDNLKLEIMPKNRSPQTYTYDSRTMPKRKSRHLSQEELRSPSQH